MVIVKGIAGFRYIEGNQDVGLAAFYAKVGNDHKLLDKMSSLKSSMKVGDVAKVQ